MLSSSAEPVPASRLMRSGTMWRTSAYDSSTRSKRAHARVRREEAAAARRPGPSGVPLGLERQRMIAARGRSPRGHQRTPRPANAPCSGAP